MNFSSKESVKDKILRLKKEKNAVILAHFYQVAEIQDIADFVGDSLGLAEAAKKTSADLIVFCGVHFMAETAKILNPSKKVLLPDLEAGCSLADSCKPEDFSEFVKNHPDHTVISYINCSAGIKCLSDIICTSSNALHIVNSLPEDEKIIFAPDRNLGAYINGISGRNMILWDGSCEVHDLLSVERVFELKSLHPDALVIAHPECKAQVLALADFIGSTNALLKFSAESEAKKFIVVTEGGILHQMRKSSPDKEFILVPSEESCNCNDCPYMKLNTMEKLANCLEHEFPEIILDEETIKEALIPMERMLELSKDILKNK